MTRPSALAQLQSFIHIAAFATSLRAWGKAVYLYQIHAIPPAFVFQHRKEHSKGNVRNRLDQIMIACHAFHIQVLHTDGVHLTVVRECMGDFVKEY